MSLPSTISCGMPYDAARSEMRVIFICLAIGADDVLGRVRTTRVVLATGHRDHDTGIFGTAFEVETVKHGLRFGSVRRDLAGVGGDEGAEHLLALE